MSIGITYKEMGWLFLVLPVMIAVFVVIGWLVMQTNSAANGIFDGLEDRLYESRMLYSPYCFAEQDITSGRTYTGTIDITKFNEDTVRECLPLKNHDRAVLMELEYVDSTGQNKTLSLRTQNWNTMRTQTKLIANTYLVNVKDEGPGRLIFTHRS